MNSIEINSALDKLEHANEEMNAALKEVYDLLMMIPINMMNSEVSADHGLIAHHKSCIDDELVHLRKDVNKMFNVFHKDEWYMDDDRIRIIMRAVECYFKKHPYESYEITIDDFERKQDDTHGSVLYISGNVKGVSYYTYNQKDADDYDVKEFSFDLQFCVGGFTSNYFERTGRVNFFKDLIYYIIDDIDYLVENEADHDYDLMTNGE